MAYPGKRISNPVTGQSIHFLKTAGSTNGELLEMESIYPGRSTEPVPHYHPKQAEHFTVISGELSVRIDGVVRVLSKGSTIDISANTIHSMWNDSHTETVVNWKVTPALDSEYFLETGIGLASDGKVNRKGMPDILQVSLLANRFSHVYRLARPSYLVQKALFSFLSPIAWLAGKRSLYRKYLD